jgi:hypothetical protein
MSIRNQSLLQDNKTSTSQQGEHASPRSVTRRLASIAPTDPDQLRLPADEMQTRHQFMPPVSKAPAAAGRDNAAHGVAQRQIEQTAHLRNDWMTGAK